MNEAELQEVRDWCHGLPAGICGKVGRLLSELARLRTEAHQMHEALERIRDARVGSVHVSVGDLRAVAHAALPGGVA